MLTADDIRFLLDLLAQRVVVTPTEEFPFTITKKSFGYSDDATISGLQAKLSIMLEVKARIG